MYDDRKEKFSFKTFFLTLLLVLLFVFLMLWLFPTKNYLKNNLLSTYDVERLSTIYGEVFANNVDRMKDAAIGYFTNERLPKIVGQSTKLTLKEMYKLHLVLDLKDLEGNSCDVSNSYVKVTKKYNEYQMKVNLNCGDIEDYIIIYLGCYDYCSDSVCEKRVISETKRTETKTPVKEIKEKEKTPEEEKATPEEEKDTPEEEKDTPEEEKEKEYLYEYRLFIEGSSIWSDWSDWTKEKIIESSLVKVETKFEREVVKYNSATIKTGTTTEKQVSTITEKYFLKFSSKLVQVGTKQVQTGTKEETYTEKIKTKTNYNYVSTENGTVVPANTSNNYFKVISTDTPVTCSYCENETIYTWEVYNIEDVYEDVSITKTVPVYKTVNVYEKQLVPVYDYKTFEVVREIQVPVTKTIKVPVYDNVIYYRSKTLTVIEDFLDIKWSTNKNDQQLINKGYKLTGNVKEI